ncbi:hypothetical protein Xcel_2907 [Xylanimonas cellulosilytica DSM 15894]|uniref:LPXTG-motif cell wall anchor domain protein n=1 Tax=Xylanimonas cellulosilytica (strain DSM 15894 / JCM 12276 / CECT 5975 / KCTC 9989 / LMG 20990 / NBRC 107835 / XIL07) TaxID=446471 RepID=D1BZ18_XYLCX|nr:hypothetical protein [Xylanimonas cellulosilytica]ACZ31915.1 hypothetical protein Xcel_2907 [Xylanimonas cellulosilytica DSM 15894]
MQMRRIAPAIALAGALVLAPVTAMADSYPPPEVPEITTSLAGTVAEPGESFTLTIPAEDGDEVTLTITNPNVPSSAIQIAGTASKTKIAVGNDGVTFTVTLTQPGNFALTGTVNGEVVMTKQIAVQEATTGTSAADSDDAGAVHVATGGQLDVTGSEAVLYGLGALLLVGAGTTAIVASRKRRNATA